MPLLICSKKEFIQKQYKEENQEEKCVYEEQTEINAMALQYAGIDIDWNGYRIPNYLYGLYITDQYESFSLVKL